MSKALQMTKRVGVERSRANESKQSGRCLGTDGGGLGVWTRAKEVIEPTAAVTGAEFQEARGLAQEQIDAAQGGPGGGDFTSHFREAYSLLGKD